MNDLMDELLDPNSRSAIWVAAFFDPQDNAWIESKFVGETQAEVEARIAVFIPDWNSTFTKHQISLENFRVTKEGA